MRLNQFIARHTGHSRRAADRLIEQGSVTINGRTAALGQAVNDDDQVAVNGQIITTDSQAITIMLNKPVGYVCSRDGQGSATIYELLPQKLHHLKPIGRLDKDSTGLLMMTNDGQLAHQLAHPSFAKQKLYQVRLNKPLTPGDHKTAELGVTVEDYVSRLKLTADGPATNWTVSLAMGKNRQVRRTFEALGYRVTSLHRTSFGPYLLGDLKPGKFCEVTTLQQPNAKSATT